MANPRPLWRARSTSYGSNPWLSRDDVIASSARLGKRGQITEGARAIAKKLGHAKKGGFNSAFAGVKPTQASAEGLIRDILGNPSRVTVGKKVTDVFNASGQGVRFNNATGRFVTFLEGALVP